jgi:hypothetical protein
MPARSAQIFAESGMTEQSLKIFFEDCLFVDFAPCFRYVPGCFTWRKTQ